MGLRYIEQVKSIILILLILLSLTLTFTIWTFSPTYDTIDTPIVDISIADKKKIEDVVKPYRVLFSHEETMTGSETPLNIEKVLNLMKNWELQTIEPVNNRASFQQINDYITTSNRITFMYPTDVPIKTFGSIFSFADHNFPDISFNRLVIDMNGPAEGEVVFYFINTTKQKVYKSRVEKVDREALSERLIKQTVNLKTYSEIVRPGKLSIFASDNPENITGYTYILEEIPPEKFKNALFTSPSLVRSNPVGTNGQEYTDDSALMTVDFLFKRLSYVHPASESKNPGIPAELIQHSVDFINEHNGWTDDYRYNRINPATQQVSYQLYMNGLPVFSNDTSTEISQFWGVNRVYRYIRPYYSLNNSTLIKKRDVQLPSGKTTYDLISSEVKASSVDDMVVSYYLSQDDQQPLLNLTPSWYYLSKGIWTRVSPDILGGGKFGLE
ncbi:YycH family regulatory protein [Psychrobacillus sp. NPDC058041]|uniref:YycH family regulatory protein n=1 Tax=Psychrobacillus sp. NPDC058041 TaxID=3346310 RepID=UPI0036D812DC